jgi:hypothetical protein
VAREVDGLLQLLGARRSTRRDGPFRDFTDPFALTIVDVECLFRNAIVDDLRGGGPQTIVEIPRERSVVGFQVAYAALLVITVVFRSATNFC